MEEHVFLKLLLSLNADGVNTFKIPVSLFVLCRAPPLGGASE